MVKHTLMLVLALGVPRATPLAAQLPEAEEAFRRGDYRSARAGYESVLAQDSANVRALYRLALLDSWDGKLVRSLARFVVLRRFEPLDGDIMVAHARVLSWAGRNAQSEALYDSALTQAPGRADAMAGRARAVAWSGDLERAERLWREAVDAHPDDAETLVGLAQTLWWKGQPVLAEAVVARARSLAPDDRAASDLERELRAALRPEVATSADYAHDSDDNAFVAQDATLTGALSRTVRGGLRGGWRRATDPVRRGLSYGLDGYVVTPLGRGAMLRAGAGGRRLEPETGTVRTPFTAELGIGLRPGRYTSVGLSYSRRPFDETARLIETGHIMDALDVSFDLSPKPGVSVSGGAGVTWLSDGNRRLSGVLAVLVTPARGTQVGALARVMGYREENPGRGYFAPGRFTIVEARGAYSWRRERWGVRADAGIGGQQVGAGNDLQTEWHLGLSVSKGWSANSEAALVGSVTNSAASSQTGAPQFTYWTVGLRVRQGL